MGIHVVDIPQRRLDARMSKQLLHRVHVNPTHQPLRRSKVTKFVELHPFEASFGAASLEGHPWVTPRSSSTFAPGKLWRE
jgi:hypothetical protein